MPLQLKFFHQALRPGGGEVKPHVHSCHELVYYEKGSGTLEMGGQTYAYSPHTCALIPPELSHAEKHAADTIVRFIGFSAEEEAPPAGFYTDSSERVLAWMRKIMEEAREQPPLHERMEGLLLSAACVELQRQLALRPGRRSLAYAAAYLRENYHQPVSIHALAQACGWQYDHFQHTFRRDMGLSPQQYLMRQRLEGARRMLLDGRSCTETAHACGFSSAAQFSSLFRRAYGQPPKAFSREHLR